MSKIAEYFFVAGLKEEQLNKQPLTVGPVKFPIEDIAIINRTKGEKIPEGYECYEYTPSNFLANLNHGSLVAPEMFLCFKRGHHKPPITDIGIYENNNKYKAKSNCEVIRLTPDGHVANINNTNDHYYLTVCRAPHKVDWDSLAVTDICAILPKKGEMVPHCFHKIDKCLNKGVIGSEMYLCYRKSYIKSKCLTYQPDILLKYPTMNDPNLPDASQLSQFCLPQGARIERWGDTPRQPLPSFTTFVLTNGLNVKKYGVSLSFYIDLPNHSLTEEQKDYFNDDGDDNKGGNRGDNRNSNGGSSRGGGGGSGSSNGGGEDDEGVKNNDGEVDKRVKDGGGEVKDGGEDAGIKEVSGEKYTFKQNQAICIISSEASMEPLKKFLHLVFRLSVSGPQAIPIEKYIYFFLNQTHLPSLNKTYLSIHLATEEIVVMKSEETPLPKSGASFSRFLLNFGVENCIRLLLCVLLEHKMVVHSVLPELLTSVVETISALIFPFSWQCPYIPMCPQPEIIHSPTPFIIGLDSSYLDTSDSLPSDVTYVHLDAPLIATWDARVDESFSLLPKKALKTLKSSLSKLYDELLDDNNDIAIDDFNFIDALRQHDQTRRMDSRIQESFLRFMCDVMQGYQHFLLPLRHRKSSGNKGDLHWNGVNVLFNQTNFIRSKDRSYHKLLHCIIKTQYFCRFIEERSLGSSGNSKLWFFDDCLLKISTNPNEPLLPNHEPVNKETEKISLHDSLTEVPGVFYLYNSFEDLKMDRFDSTLHHIRKKDHENDEEDEDDDDEAKRKTNEENISTSMNKKKRKEIQRNTFDDTYTHTSKKTAKGMKEEGETKTVIVSRTKREREKSSKLMSHMTKNDDDNAECILWTCYSLWFTLLPTFLMKTRAKSLLMRLALKTLIKCLSCKGCDEMPYKVFLQLCCLYREPNLASEAFKSLKEHSLPLSADTYGFYNMALYQTEEGRKEEKNKGMMRWRRVIIIIIAVHHLKSLCEERSRRMTSSSSSLSGSTNNQSKGSTSSWSSKRLNKLFETFKSFKDRPSSGRSERFKSERFTGSVMSVIEKGTGLKINLKISNSENNVNIVSEGKGTLTNNKNNNNSEEEDRDRYNDILRKTSSYNVNNSDDDDENTFNQSTEDDVTPCVSLSSNRLRPFAPVPIPPITIDPPPPIIIDPPAHYVIHPSNNASNHSNNSSDPSNNSSDPSNNSSDPSNNSSDPSNNSSDPSNNSSDPSNNSSDPSNNSSDPSHNSSAPLNNISAPLNNISEPLNNISEPLNNKTCTLANTHLNTSISQSAESPTLLSTNNTTLDTTTHTTTNTTTTTNMDTTNTTTTNVTPINTTTTNTTPTTNTTTTNTTTINMNTSNKCPNCASLLLDEHIMAGWVTKEDEEEDDDDSLSCLTACCSILFRPQLHVTINKTSSTLHFPFFNPLKLRHRLECYVTNLNMIGHEDDLLEEDPVLFWNLMWFFNRLKLPTHLSELLTPFRQETHKQDVKLFWDQPFQIFSTPMYQSFRDSKEMAFSITSLQAIISGFNTGNFPIEMLLADRSKFSNNRTCFTYHRGLYHDVLFLVISVYGSESVNLDHFDATYNNNIINLDPLTSRKLMTMDFVPSNRSRHIRRKFPLLSLP